MFSMFSHGTQKIKIPLALIGISAIGFIPLGTVIYKDSFAPNPQPGPPPPRAQAKKKETLL